MKLAIALGLVALVACSDDGASTASGGVGGTGTGDATGGSATAGSGGSGGEAGGTTSSTGGGSSGGAGGAGGGLGDPAVFRAADDLAVCSATPPNDCTPSDLDFVASEYGSTFTRHDADATAYRLVAFVEREGPSNIDVLVVDEMAQPIVGLPVAFYYSSAPDPSRADEWYPNKITGVTQSNGVVGFAIGGGAYLPACGAGGPHAVWVSEPGSDPNTTVPSDLADALGMLGGTNHRHLDLIFQRVTPGEPAVDAVTCPLQP
jgi:hypothetical protein